MHDFIRSDAFITGVHRFYRFTVPPEVDLWLFIVPDAAGKFIHQANPLVKIGVLYGITVIRGSIVANIRAKTICE